MHRGYTKSWRKRWDKDYCKDHLLFVMMHYFIDHANWRDTEMYIPNVGVIPLKQGQHLFSTTKLSMKLGVDRQRIRTKLKILEKVGFLTKESTNRYTIISVTNYSTYQSDDESTNQRSNQHLTSIQPASNQHLTTDKKDKNIKKVKKVKNKIKNPNAKKGGLEKKAQAVLRYLNKKKGSKYRDYSFIIPRLKDGGTVKDCIQIIDNKLLDDYFKKNPKFLNPQTLFRKSNWDKYLNDTPHPLEGKVSKTTQHNIEKLKKWGDRSEE